MCTTKTTGHAPEKFLGVSSQQCHGSYNGGGGGVITAHSFLSQTKNHAVNKFITLDE